MGCFFFSSNPGCGDREKIICPESKQWSKPFVCLKWLTLLGGRIRTDDGASRRSYGILASDSTPVWAVPRLRSALIQKMCSPGVAGELCSAQPGPHLLLLNCLWGVLIFSKGSRERHSEPKTCAPCNGTASVGASWWSPCLRAGGLMSNPLLMTDTTSPPLVGVRKLWGCDTEITF